MKVTSVEKKIIVKEITLETLEERAIMLAMINLAFETKNFKVRAENQLFKIFGQSIFTEISSDGSDTIQDMLNKIKRKM